MDYSQSSIQSKLGCWTGFSAGHGSFIVGTLWSSAGDIFPNKLLIWHLHVYYLHIFCTPVVALGRCVKCIPCCAIMKMSWWTDLWHVFTVAYSVWNVRTHSHKPNSLMEKLKLLARHWNKQIQNGLKFEKRRKSITWVKAFQQSYI